jgi:multisubunit Na+/H+ antiporter MnhF subunit
MKKHNLANKAAIPITLAIFTLFNSPSHSRIIVGPKKRAKIVMKNISIFCK